MNGSIELMGEVSHFKFHQRNLDNYQLHKQKFFWKYIIISLTVPFTKRIFRGEGVRLSTYRLLNLSL